ncbi:leucine-rich repeat domain-containing protein [Weissella cibaria]|uniref:leucine-rich repeat domain-containing protein n=1 Tax=Weissella cibaria TaxID=137591 RepID=UPI000E5495C7|nr:leucine-rich repeat domain-containing protein [Weissella cibaria]RHE72661.1 leucine-rich repeat domain-containing protein [Weissella cibaria]RHE79045.1 leucine-rich repeat domain-containing protein [Weissella cibaria]
MRKENTKRIAELATVALLSTVGSSTISQTLPLILMIQSAIVSADATVPAQTDRLAANLPAAVVAAFVNSPVNAAKNGGAKTLAEAMGLSSADAIQKVTYADLSKLTALDLSTVSNNFLNMKDASGKTVSVDNVSFWESSNGMFAGSVAQKMFQAAAQAQNLTTLNLNGILAYASSALKAAGYNNTIGGALAGWGGPGTDLFTTVKGTGTKDLSVIWPNLKNVDLSNNNLGSDDYNGWMANGGWKNIEKLTFYMGGNSSVPSWISQPTQALGSGAVAQDTTVPQQLYPTDSVISAKQMAADQAGSVAQSSAQAAGLNESAVKSAVSSAIKSVMSGSAVQLGVVQSDGSKILTVATVTGSGATATSSIAVSVNTSNISVDNNGSISIDPSPSTPVVNTAASDAASAAASYAATAKEAATKAATALQNAGTAATASAATVAAAAAADAASAAADAASAADSAATAAKSAATAANTAVTTAKEKAGLVSDTASVDAATNYATAAANAAATAAESAKKAEATATSKATSEAAAASKPSNDTSSSETTPGNGGDVSSSNATDAQSTAIAAYASSAASALSAAQSANQALRDTDDYTKMSNYAAAVASAASVVASVTSAANSIASLVTKSDASLSGTISDMASELSAVTSTSAAAATYADPSGAAYKILKTYSAAASAGVVSVKSLTSAAQATSDATTASSYAAKASSLASQVATTKSTAASLLAGVSNAGSGISKAVENITSAQLAVASYAKDAGAVADSLFAKTAGSAATDGDTTSVQMGILKTYSQNASSAALAAQNAYKLTQATSNGSSAASYAKTASSAANAASSAAAALDALLKSIGANPGSVAKQMDTDGASYLVVAQSAATAASSYAANVVATSSAATWESGGLAAIASSAAAAKGSSGSVTVTYKKANTNTTQLLPKGVLPTTTLASWGLPKPFIDAILKQSMTFDGDALSDHIRNNSDGLGETYTDDNVTFGDLMYISKLDWSDPKHDNGIYDYFKNTQSWQLSIYSPDTWQSASKFNWNNGQQLFASFDAIIMATTTMTSLDMSNWKASEKEPASSSTSEDSNWSSSFGYLNLAQLPNLKQLSVAYDNLGNQLFGGQDFQMFHADQLTTLDISGNIMTQLGGQSGSSRIVTGYPKLVNLNMSNMPVMSTFPPELNNANNDFAKRIQSLQIDHDNFTTLPAWITVAAQNGLIILTATGNNLTSADSKLLQKPSSLEYLDLTGQDNPSTDLNSFFLDNSGTQAIQEYNKIMNDPEMQIWLANDPNGALAQEVAALRKQIEDRAEYQSTLNDYTDLLARAELDPSQQSVTVTVTVTTSVVINGQSYTVKLPYDPDNPYDPNDPAQVAKLQALAMSQLKSDHPELVDLKTDDLQVASVKTPLTVSDLLDYVDKHKDEASVASAYFDKDGNPTAVLQALQSQADSNPKGLASYNQLPAAPKPSEYKTADGSTVPSYYDTQGALLSTVKQATITDATITVAKIQQVQKQLEAAGDTAGAAALQKQVDSVQDVLNNIPVVAGAETDSDFFYIRSLTKQIQTSTDTVTTVATENTLSQLSDTTTKELIKQAVANGSLAADAGSQLIAAGDTSLIDLAKNAVQTAVDGGSISDEMGHKLTDNAKTVQDIRNNIDDQMNTKDSSGKGMLDTTTGNNLLGAVDAAVSQGQNSFTTDTAAAVGNAVASSVANSVAAAAGLDSEATKSLADELASKAVTNADEVTKALTTDTANGGLGGALLNNDGTVNSSASISDAVTKAQSAISSASSAADTASSGQDDTATVAPETGSVSVLQVQAPDNPFATYTSSKMFNTLIPTQETSTQANPNMNVTIFDNRVYCGDLNVTAQLSSPFALTGTMNGTLSDAQVILSKTALDTTKPVSNIFSSDTSTAMGGLLQQNQIAIGTGKATLVATGQVDPKASTSTLNFGNVYLRIPGTNDGTTQLPTPGNYGATITWTVNAGQANGSGNVH